MRFNAILQRLATERRRDIQTRVCHTPRRSHSGWLSIPISHRERNDSFLQGLPRYVCCYQIATTCAIITVKLVDLQGFSHPPPRTVRLSGTGDYRKLGASLSMWGNGIGSAMHTGTGRSRLREPPCSLTLSSSQGLYSKRLADIPNRTVSSLALFVKISGARDRRQLHRDAQIVMRSPMFTGKARPRHYERTCG
ncbi:hypothetical protein C8R47DRAFT_400414 [Mycena vitilis]|nr:hypothetical protein C8R47DRAFT_400414 [Mycena vitilis]